MIRPWVVYQAGAQLTMELLRDLTLACNGTLTKSRLLYHIYVFQSANKAISGIKVKCRITEIRRSLWPRIINITYLLECLE